MLDPEQNRTFRDHYLGVEFDLSHVMFVATANLLDPIPPAFRDRLEVMRLSGYTEREKLHIAREHLLPRQLDETGLDRFDVSFDDDAVRYLVRRYTREPGLRELERQLGACCRKIARQIAMGEKGLTHVTPEVAVSLLGPERYSPDQLLATPRVGVATGLALTAAGGEVLFVEATLMPGSGKLTLTGQLGDVMKESAQAALSYIRSHAQELGIEASTISDHDIHVHIPAGATPKDGPSAGVTLLASLVSVLTERPVSTSVAMTERSRFGARSWPWAASKRRSWPRPGRELAPSSSPGATRRTSSTSPTRFGPPPRSSRSKTWARCSATPWSGRSDPIATDREHDLIRSLRRRAARRGGVSDGLGDDAAILSSPLPNLVATDVAVDGVHFDRSWTPLECVGWKALAAALSDISAMGGRPTACLTSIVFPPDVTASDLKRIYDGLLQLAQTRGAPLVGGDTAAGPGPLTLDVTVLGRASRPVTRSGARPGDRLAVTAPLGLAALGLSRLRGGARLSRARGLSRKLLLAQLRPSPISPGAPGSPATPAPPSTSRTASPPTPDISPTRATSASRSTRPGSPWHPRGRAPPRSG